MGNNVRTGTHLSQEEVSALFSLEHPRDLNPGNSCEANRTDAGEGVLKSSDTNTAPARESKAGAGLVESQSEGGSAESIDSKPPVSYSEEKTQFSSLHGSLSLEAILRSCRQIYREHFSLGGISLVLPKGNTSTATVYSLNEGPDAPIVGPHLITLESSRLKECILKRQHLVAWTVDASELDNIERDFLHVIPHQGSVSIAYLPLMLLDRLKGVLVLSFSETGHLTADNTEFLSLMASHLAIAIENCDHFYEGYRRSRQFSLISRIAKLAAGEIENNVFFPEACELLCRSFDYDTVQIWIASCNRFELVGSVGPTCGDTIADPQIPSMVQECCRRKQVVCNDEMGSEFGAEPNSEGIWQLAMPIHFGGNFAGALYIDSGHSAGLTAEDLSTMESIAALIASRLRNLQTFNNSQRSGEYLHAVLEAANDWAILSTDIHGYVITCSVGLQRVFRLPQQVILGTDILNLFTNPQIQRELICFIDGTTKAFCLERFHVPQVNGKTITYLDLTFQRVYDHDKQQIGFLCVVRDVTQKRSLVQKLKALSITDDVTGLYNQRGFFRALKTEIRRCMKSHRNLSLCFLDLDNLKQFNDTYGHLSGSQALRETAGILHRSLRPNIDVCCRYGGDEFAIIMPQVSKAQAALIVERIRLLLCQHFEGKMTGSFGIADNSDRTIEATELLARADRAMYSAKFQGKNCVVVSE
jgi:diguanylate cyclase (GGDEF)-like protein